MNRENKRGSGMALGVAVLGDPEPPKLADRLLLDQASVLYRQVCSFVIIKDLTSQRRTSG